ANGCGNNATRLIGFTDSNAAVAAMLVIVGDNTAGQNGNNQHISFIGPKLIEAKAKVSIAKLSTNGTGTFSFTALSNLSHNTDAVTTSTSGVAVTSTQTNTATAFNTAVTMTETLSSSASLVAASCMDANSATTGNTGSFGVLVANVLTIPASYIRAGADITCTFMNGIFADLTINKTGAATGTAIVGINFDYRLSVTNNGAGDSNGVVTVTDTLPLGTDFVSATGSGWNCGVSGQLVSCTSNAVIVAGANAPPIILTVKPTAQAICAALTNTANVAGGGEPVANANNNVSAPVNTTLTGCVAVVAVLKHAAAPVFLGSNQYRVDYTITVSNTGNSVGHYRLDDTLAFNGANIDSVSVPVNNGPDLLATVINPLFNGQGNNSNLVEHESIAAGNTEQYVYTVTYTVMDGVRANDCISSANGLRNNTVLSGADFSGNATTCTAQTTIEKTVGTLTATGTPNQYTLTYQITVKNNNPESAGHYTLTDSLSYPGSTISRVSTPAHGGADTLGSLINTAFNGQDANTIVDNESIAAGSSDSFSYTVTFTINDPAAIGSCPNTGLLNKAKLSGDAEGSVATCTPVPTVKVVKNTIDGESSVDFTVSGGAMPSALRLITVGNVASQLLNNVTLGQNLTIVETVPIGWTQSSVLCQDALKGVLSLPHIMESNDNITCTFINVARKQATLKLTKQWVNAHLTDAVTVTTTGFVNDTHFDSIVDAANEADTAPGVTVYAGETGTLAEIFTAGNPNDYSASAWACDGGNVSGNDTDTDTHTDTHTDSYTYAWI
ncbi:MAG: hypothetical protein NTV00_01830, partial [Methylococcales bacterium]|nr:hypothetical protein [Methylococcales bacterium]